MYSGNRERVFCPWPPKILAPTEYLHRHIMSAYNPSLVFVGVPVVYTPFPIADVVSTWIVLAWLGETPYPNTPDGRLTYEGERLASIDKWQQGIKNPSSLVVYNVLGPTEQEYARQLREDIVKARPELGKILPVWNDERTALREAIYGKKLNALQYAKSRTNSI